MNALYRHHKSSMGSVHIEGATTRSISTRTGKKQPTHNYASFGWLADFYFKVQKGSSSYK